MHQTKGEGHGSSYIKADLDLILVDRHSREGGREEWREGEMDGGCDGGRDRWREGGREGERVPVDSEFHEHSARLPI